MPHRRRTKLALTSLVAVLALVAAACGGDDDSAEGTTTEGDDSSESIVLYSGRDEELVGPLIEQFTESTGIEVDVRYGNSAEMAAQLLEEGESTPADVFYSQEVGALGALSRADLLSPLPDEVVEVVDERYRPAEGTDWVGVTGRSRVIVVNPDLVDEVPSSVTDLTDEQYRGQVAWAPGNASFQSFITAFRVAEGEEAAEQWLDDMIANEPQTFERNGEILEAVENGTVPLGLINHYYWAILADEVGGPDSMDSELVYPEGDDPGALVNATAVGITTKGADDPGALALVEFLLSAEGQERFVEETWEYPLVDGVDGPDGVPPLEDLGGPTIDLTDLDSLEETQQLLTEKGLLS
jgi:iron(III) transport system substrate-binding protein